VRWFWIDRFIEFESGRRATAVKAITLAEEQLDNYIPGYPVMPAPLIVEGFAQAGGLLVGESHQFRERVVLAKVSRAKFFREARPGEVLTYEVEAEYIAADGSGIKGRGRIGDEPFCEVDLLFAHLDGRFEGVDLFYPADFLCILRLFGLYDVGRQADGSPLEVPPHLLEAEAVASQSGLN
jgi:3-hydroxyacyl-[acyl-carrier-protein] dehydratase